MYSTWVDNDHHNDANGRRIESASKKQPANRIQVYGNNNLESPKLILSRMVIKTK